MIRLALIEPDIAPNVGTLIRLAACLGLPLEIIEPCGFPFDTRQLKRAALDYLVHAEITRHASLADFLARHAAGSGRLILLTTKGETDYARFRFAPDDVLMAGRESAGAPPAAHQAAAARLYVPLRGGLRSLNVAVASAMVIGEALRQTAQFPTRP